MVTLERLVDRESLEAVLAALSIICSEKAAFIEKNYKDKGDASRRWDSAAKRIDTTAKSSAIQAVTY
jgi:hypothetical protein